MAGVLQKKPRRVIPRWRLFSTTASLGELRSVGNTHVPPFGTGGIARLVADWQSEKTIWHATDLLSASFVFGNREVAEQAAAFVLENQDKATPAALALARRITYGYRNEAPETRDYDWSVVIRSSRSALREYSRDAMRWTDLALAHTICGNINHSLRCIRVALQLAPENRFVMRAAVRCYLHWGDPERAHWVLKSAQRTEHDPWLLSAELAVASVRGRRSRFVPAARRLTEDRSIDPHSLSELATALGTLEVDYGSQKKAAKLFSQALAEPTENAVAQIEWLVNEKTDLSLVGVAENLNVPFLFEAKAADRFADGDWSGAVQNAKLWLSDQPFSSRPADVASYALSFLGQYGEAVRYLQEAQDSNPDDPGLLNNLTYFQILSGRLKDAEETFRQLSGLTVEDDLRLIVQATAGLIEFRHKNFDKGRRLYRSTMREAASKNKREVNLIASINLAREEHLIGNLEESRRLLDEARREIGRSRSKTLHAELAAVDSAVAATPVPI